MGKTPGWRIWLVALLCSIGLSAAAQQRALPGQYFCVAAATCPCQSDTALQLTGHGTWSWGAFAGSYTVSENTARFDGNGGTATWGPASVGPGTLTFTAGPAAITCWLPDKTEARP